MMKPLLKLESLLRVLLQQPPISMSGVFVEISFQYHSDSQINEIYLAVYQIFASDINHNF